MHLHSLFCIDEIKISISDLSIKIHNSIYGYPNWRIGNVKIISVFNPPIPFPISHPNPLWSRVYDFIFSFDYYLSQVNTSIPYQTLFFSSIHYTCCVSIGDTTVRLSRNKLPQYQLSAVLWYFYLRKQNMQSWLNKILLWAIVCFW